MVFREILEAWNQHQVIAAQGKNLDRKPEGREFGIDVAKLKLPERGAAAPYGAPSRGNTSTTLGSGPGKL